MLRKYEKQHPLRTLFAQAKRSFQMWAISHMEAGQELLVENQNLKNENTKLKSDSELHVAVAFLEARAAMARWINQLIEHVHVARHDVMLTGMLNKAALHDDLKKEHKRAARTQDLCVVVADLNGFKNLNDTKGHAEADKALFILQEILLGTLRPYDSLGRTGGDEFTILLPGCKAAQAGIVTRRFAQAVDNDPRLKEYGLTIALGIAPYHPSAEKMLARADKAMYVAKKTMKAAEGAWHSCVHCAEDEPAPLKTNIVPVGFPRKPALPTTGLKTIPPKEFAT